MSIKKVYGVFEKFGFLENMEKPLKSEIKKPIVIIDFLYKE